MKYFGAIHPDMGVAKQFLLMFEPLWKQKWKWIMTIWDTSWKLMNLDYSFKCHRLLYLSPPPPPPPPPPLPYFLPYSAHITRSSIVRYCINAYRNWSRISDARSERYHISHPNGVFCKYLSEKNWLRYNGIVLYICVCVCVCVMFCVCVFFGEEIQLSRGYAKKQIYSQPDISWRVMIYSF